MTDLTWWKGIILGFVQGVTEFFPVSSSAHLVIAQTYLNIKDPVHTLAVFDVALHFGSLVAAVYYFRWELAWIFGVWVKPWREKLGQANAQSFLDGTTARRVGPLIVLGILPVGILGAIFQRFITDLFSDIFMVSIFLLITGSVLHATRKIVSDGISFGEMNFKHALLIGLAQVFAILPGLSRSGLTIAAGLFLKLKPDAAFRFSFLMMIPLVAGAGILNLGEFRYFQVDTLLAVLLGAVTAGYVGYFCIRVMLKLMVGGKFPFFAYYCWAVGGLVLVRELFF